METHPAESMASFATCTMCAVPSCWNSMPDATTSPVADFDVIIFVTYASVRTCRFGRSTAGNRYAYESKLAGAMGAHKDTGRVRWWRSCECS